MSKFWWSVAGVITVALVLVSAVVGILHKSFTYEESLRLTSGDTRRISSYSSTFCKKLRLESAGMPNNLNTSLFIVPDYEAEKLSKSNVFSTRIAGLSLPSYQHQYWKVFLHPNSTVTLEACVLNGEGMEVFIIRNGDFNERRNSLDSPSQTLRVPITNRCDEGPVKNKTLDPSDYHIEDVYYILFVGLESSVVNVLNGTLFFAIPEYDTTEVEVVSRDHCSTGIRPVLSCPVHVPLNFGTRGVISAEKTSLGLDSSIAAVDVKVSCEPRAWVYAVIVIVAVIVTAIVCFVGARVNWYMKNRRYIPLHGGQERGADGGQDQAAAAVADNRGCLDFHT